MFVRIWIGAALGAGFLFHAQAIAADRNWNAYLGDKASSQYSTLKQINRTNVDQLRVAWIFHTGDADFENRSQIQCNPLVIDGVLYGTSPGIKLVALDAATGKELWRFDPFARSPARAPGVNRGLVYWSDGDDRRILFGADHYLYAIDAATGLPMDSFGAQGRIDLKEGLGRDVKGLSLTANTPGVVYHDFLITGMSVGEGPAPAAPGHIRAYDVRTGKLVWRFNTIPQPGEFGCDTWPPDAYKRIGGANVWSGMAVDEKRGIVFCPTGSAAFDFWGGDRIGQNLFANCLIALDANTGRRIWHYQFVHHDLWDRDLPAPPNLITVSHNGKRIDAVAQVTKSGHVFVFNRETGESLFPIEELSVPPSNLQGESTWPTQPVPTQPQPFARQVFSLDEITDISPDSHQAVLEQFVKLPPHVPFLPPGTKGTIIFPGFDGGAEWGGAATDPEGILYVNENEMPWILRMVETRQRNDSTLSNGAEIYLQICAACHGLDRKGNAAQGVASLVSVGQRLKKEDVLALLLTGKGKMPSFGFLNDAQKQAVTDHLWLLDAADGLNDSTGSMDARPPNEPGRRRREESLFSPQRKNETPHVVSYGSGGQDAKTLDDARRRDTNSSADISGVTANSSPSPWGEGRGEGDRTAENSNEASLVDARESTTNNPVPLSAAGDAEMPLPIPYTHTGYNRWFDPEGYPAVKPPWGTLNAIDLNTGELKWRVPLGEFPELTARGIPPTGTENYGGPVVTAGDLIFIAASKDEFIRAFDRRNGRELWKHKLPAGGYATPATYEVNGRQYVVIACGGGKMGTKSGDAYVAFELAE